MMINRGLLYVFNTLSVAMLSLKGEPPHTVRGLQVSRALCCSYSGFLKLTWHLAAKADCFCKHWLAVPKIVVTDWFTQPVFLHLTCWKFPSIDKQFLYCFKTKTGILFCITISRIKSDLIIATHQVLSAKPIPSLRPVSDENKGASVVPPHGLEIPVLLVAKINTPDPLRQLGRKWKSEEMEKKKTEQLICWKVFRSADKGTDIP